MNGNDRDRIDILADKIDVVESKVDIILTKLEYIERRDDDHERRIRASERWRYAIPPAVLVALGSAWAVFVR